MIPKNASPFLKKSKIFLEPRAYGGAVLLHKRYNFPKGIGADVKQGSAIHLRSSPIEVKKHDGFRKNHRANLNYIAIFDTKVSWCILVHRSAILVQSRNVWCI